MSQRKAFLFLHFVGEKNMVHITVSMNKNTQTSIVLIIKNAALHACSVWMFACIMTLGFPAAVV